MATIVLPCPFLKIIMEALRILAHNSLIYIVDPYLTI